MEWVLIWLGLAIAAGVIASSKGRSGFGYFALGLLLPLIAILIAIGISDQRAANGKALRRDGDLVLCHSCNRPRRVDSATCPHCYAGAPDPHAGQKKCVACAEWILKEATKCKHCGEMQTSPSVASTPMASADMGYCPGCGKLRHPSVLKCVYCNDLAPVTPSPVTQAADTSIDWSGVSHSDRNIGRPN